MPRGGAWRSNSTEASAVRAANTQWSPARKPFAPADAKLTVTPFSRISVVPAGGTWITPAAVASRSWNNGVVPPGPVRSTLFFWSQRRTRKLPSRGKFASGKLPGSISAGSAGAKRMRRVASVTVILRTSPQA